MRKFIRKKPETYTEEQLIEKWLAPKRKLFFDNPQNGWYNQESKFRAVAEHWFKFGEHGPDYNDTNIMHAQSRWEEFLELFEEITEEDK